MNMIEIKETKDPVLLTTLNEEIQTYHHTIHPNIFKPYDKEAILSFFNTTLMSENTAAYIAMENNIAIGYVLLFKIDSKDNPFQYFRSYVLLDQILVVKDHQGKGVGKLLLDAVYAYAGKNSIRHIELNHWSQNESARIFLSKNHFKYYNEKMWIELE